MPQSNASTLTAKPLQQFLDELASAEPVPGGGSVAALSGVLAAALLAMVCRLTIGKKGYESVNADMQELLARAEPVQIELRELMQADIAAYTRVMDAYKLPKATDAGKQARANTIQDALKHASDVPLRVAELCSELIELARPIASHGNKNAASDAGVGALMAEAGLRGAALNVTTNLVSINDQAFVSTRRARVAQLVASAGKAQEEILSIVEGRM
ncbi:MAG: cyclodeaminase/cyclohydrolase family protein [Chloroflexi bacterium]|nr:cyclodeaminase/cyclohydrolase family protein [Chloroflexota bacterium]